MMACHALSPVEQLAQTSLRMDLVLGWGIEPGMRVLEIGCGQGDMTAVLAEAVGATGRVVAVDAAAQDYGAPLTLGESAKHLHCGELGRRVSFHFGIDVLNPAVDFADDEFDVVVLALCTWYFDSLRQIEDVLERVKPWAPRLLLAEWDLHPTSIDQLGHFMSVLIQGQVAAHGGNRGGNVRTLYSKEQLSEALLRAGWMTDSMRNVDTHGLADAQWEIDACLHQSVDPGATDSQRMLLATQLDVLRRLDVGACLPVFSLSARRCPSGASNTRP